METMMKNIIETYAQNNYKNSYVSNKELVELADELQRRLKKYDSSATVNYNNEKKIFYVFYNEGNYTIDSNGTIQKDIPNKSESNS